MASSAFIVSIPLVIVLSLALLGHVTGRWTATAEASAACGDETMEQQTRAAMLAALDYALTTHVAGLYAVWLKDPRSGQPRAKAGIDLAVASYLQGYKSVEAWKLNRC